MMLREITIGRAKDCDIYLDPRCRYASSYHGTIYLDGGQLMFKDTSSNGTMINNVSVKHRAVPIRRGDTIMLAGQYQVNWNQIDAFFPSAPQPLYRPPVAPVAPPQPLTPAYDEPDTSSFSWGAFALYPIWGFFNGCWWAFLVAILMGVLNVFITRAVLVGTLSLTAALIVPLLFSLIANVVFGLYGRRWAWENRRWSSSVSFEETQHGWDMWGIGIFCVSMLFYILMLVSADSYGWWLLLR